MGTSLKRLVILALLFLISIPVVAFPKQVRAIFRQFKSTVSGVPLPPTPTPIPLLLVCAYNLDGILVYTGLSTDNADGMVMCILASDGLYYPYDAPPPAGGGGGATDLPVPPATPLPYWEVAP